MGETLNEFGFRQKDMDFMIHLFREHPEIEKVLIYGSRGRGDFEHGSDVDIALEGKEITYETVSYIHTKLEEESPTYLWFDVLHFDTLKNQKLKEQIKKNGKLLFIQE
jgi:uncharacterized protein